MTDAKTWTCNKCQNVNPSGKCMCLKCSSGRITGLSLEDLVAPLEAENKNLREWSLMLETDVKKLRATIQDLEHQRDGHRHAHGALAERFEKLRERVRELESHHAAAARAHVELGKRFAALGAANDQCKRQFKAACAREDELEEKLKATEKERNHAVAMLDVKESRITELESQLAQAQKRVASLQSDLTFAAELLGTADPAAKAANLETAVDLLGRLTRDESSIVREGAERGLEGIQAQKPTVTVCIAGELAALRDFETTTRGIVNQGHENAKASLVIALAELDEMLKPSPTSAPIQVQKPAAQTSRETSDGLPVIVDCLKPELRSGTHPAAPPPVEVSTPNLDKCLFHLPTEKGQMIIDGHGDWIHYPTARDACQADIRAAVAAERERWEDRIDDYDRRIEADQEHAEFLQNELRMALERGDAALAAVRDLRAKLEAAEKLVGQQSDSLQTLGRTINGMAAERRQPVDRERAIGTVMELIAQVRGTGFPSDVDAARGTLDAIFGAAKAEPDAKLVTPEFVAFVECIAAGGEGRDVVAWAEHLLKMMRAEPSAFTPAPTGEAPSDELVERMTNEYELAADGQDCARAIYAIIASCHAALVKRVRELEGELGLANRERGEIRQQRDDALVEVGRLKAAASNRRCPADGMSTAEVGHVLASAGYHNNDGFWDAEAAGAKARELFTPCETAKDERKVQLRPADGHDENWIGKQVLKAIVGAVEFEGQAQDNIGRAVAKLFAHGDPSAKGAE